MLTFPAIKPITGGFAPYAKSLSGGQSLSGFEQVTSQLNDRWVASYGFAIRRDADVLLFRAFVAAMRGRANSVALPAFDLARAPYVPKRKGTPLGSVITSPLWYLSFPALKDTPYYLVPQSGIGGIVTVESADTIRAISLTAPITPDMWVNLVGVPRRLSNIVHVSGSEITATVFPAFDLSTVVRVAPGGYLAAAAALNATSVTVRLTSGSRPQPGQFFSLGTRLYSILTVSGTATFTLEIWPAIRVAALINATVEFAMPTCEMRFASDTEGVDALSSLAALRFATITLKFDEVAA